jgi:methylaspartate ammonia-lyase
MELFKLQLDYLQWLKKRITDIGDSDYHPAIHFDCYGHIGFAFDNDIPKMVAYIRKLEETAKPYDVIVEDPVNTGDKAKQVELLAGLHRALKKAGVQATTMADELCSRLEDHKMFAEADAVDMQKIKCPDLGSISNAIEGLLYLRSKGVKPYLGGSMTETERAAQVRVHMGLATQPDQMLASPGAGIDEAYCVTVNEMNRALALIGARRGARPARSK